MNGPWLNRNANINPHKTWCGLRQSPCITVWVSGPWFPVVGPYGGLLIVSEMEKKECHPGLGRVYLSAHIAAAGLADTNRLLFFKPTAGLVCILNAHKRAKQDYCCWRGNEGLSRSWRGKLRCSVLWLSGRRDGCRGSGPFSCMLEEGTLVVFFFFFLLVFRKGWTPGASRREAKLEIHEIWTERRRTWNFHEARVDFAFSRAKLHRAKKKTQRRPCSFGRGCSSPANHR